MESSAHAWCHGTFGTRGTNLDGFVAYCFRLKAVRGPSFTWFENLNLLYVCIEGIDF
jgi:hypothetical protein